MEFEDLWKFHAPVNTVEGFDVSLFDKLIEVVNGLKQVFASLQARSSRFILRSWYVSWLISFN